MNAGEDQRGRNVSYLEDIQKAAVESSSDLGSLLRKCKVFAARLGSKSLEDWLVWESNGYPNDAQLPDYRVWGVELKGHFAGPFGSELRNAPIPSLCVPKELRKRFTVFRCRQSIASIEEALKSDQTGIFRTNVGDLVVALGMNVYEGQNCLQVWGEFGVAHLVEVLNTVRNRILDFVLAIWKEDPHAGDLGGDTGKLQPDKVTQIFNTTVYGGAANVVGTATHSTISSDVQANNFGTLEQLLKENGVDADDIGQLKEDLAAEPERPSPTTFGPRVADWISNMVKKAASGIWEVGVGAASNLLAQAIARYYGM